VINLYNSDNYRKDGGNVWVILGSLLFGNKTTGEAGAIEVTGDKLKNVIKSNDVTEYSADGAIDVSGIAIATTGAVSDLAMTLAAPEEGVLARIKLGTDGGKNLVVTTATGVTFNGTNNTATFADASDELVLGYKSATEWIIIENVGSVALSTV